MTTPSPSAESLTDTTNSSFATPPFSLSPVGESQGVYSWTRIQKFDDVSLPLPPIKLVQLPLPRELVITRRKTPTQDFGFSLRKAIVLDRSESLFIPISRPVIFAEPGTSSGNGTGLLPGDRLIKVNQQPVEELAREAIIEMIRKSGNTVTVEVQPVAELVELSRRCMPKENPHQDEMDRSAIVSDCNTLRRSASKRFKSHVSTLLCHSSHTFNSFCGFTLQTTASKDNDRHVEKSLKSHKNDNRKFLDHRHQIDCKVYLRELGA